MFLLAIDFLLQSIDPLFVVVAVVENVVATIVVKHSLLHECLHHIAQFIHLSTGVFVRLTSLPVCLCVNHLDQSIANIGWLLDVQL